MKLAVIVLLALAVAASATEWVPTVPVFNQATGSTSEQIAQYQDQVAQLKLLQERENAIKGTLESQMAALAQQHAALTAQQQQAAPAAFSFKETISMGDGSAQATDTSSTDPKMKKLAAAMKAVKEDIMAKLREAKRESAWVNDVQKIVTTYNKKVRNVKKNLKKIRQDIKSLIEKKRQIRNAQIQANLQDRLKDASGDLEMIQGKLHSINAQAKAFNKNKDSIASTIAKINAELAKLKGAPKNKDKEAAAANAAPKK
jgi:chromosome segregation ATPase